MPERRKLLLLSLSGVLRGDVVCVHGVRGDTLSGLETGPTVKPHKGTNHSSTHKLSTWQMPRQRAVVSGPPLDCSLPGPCWRPMERELYLGGECLCLACVKPGVPAAAQNRTRCGLHHTTVLPAVGKFKAILCLTVGSKPACDSIPCLQKEKGLELPGVFFPDFKSPPHSFQESLNPATLWLYSRTF